MPINPIGPAGVQPAEPIQQNDPADVGHVEYDRDTNYRDFIASAQFPASKEQYNSELDKLVGRVVNKYPLLLLD